MSKHELYWIDAFTNERFGGNPCAVILSADTLSVEQMQKTAREMNLSETAFVLKSEKATFRARYFTPVEEIPLAGHPTISTIHTLIEAGKLQPSNGQKISLELKAGVINIDLFEGSNSFRIVMSQMKPEFLTIHNSERVAKIFGLEVEDLVESVPIQTVSTGTPQLMVPVRNKDSLKRAKMDVVAYKDYKSRSDFFSPHIFCCEGITTKGATFARHFGVSPDTLEDSFTGSATGGMAAYLWHYQLITRSKFIAEQGHWMGRPGSAEVEVVGDPSDIITVKVGGEAVTVFVGEIEI